MNNVALRSNSMRGLAEGLVPPRAFVASTLGPPALVAVAYYVGCLAGFALRFPGSGISFFWPPTAILTAALLLAPSRRWPWLTAGALIGHGIAHSADGIPAASWFVMFIGNATQAGFAAGLVRRFIGGHTFGDPRRILIFIVLACCGAPALASLVSAFTYVGLGWALDFRSAWRIRTISNAIAMLTIVPSVLLVWPRLQQRPFAEAHRIAEFVVLLLALVIAHAAVLPVQSNNGLSVFLTLYVPMPALLWATVRFGVAGFSFAMMWTTLLTIATALSGHGALTAASPAETVLGVQLVLIANAIPMMLLAGVVEQQRREHRALVDMEQQNRAVLRALPDQMFLLTRSGRCLSSDPLDNANGGRPFTVRTGEDIHDVLPADLVRPFSRALSAVGSREPAVLEYSYGEPGAPQRLEARFIAVDAERVLAVTRDITSRWRSEQELRETQHRYAIATAVGGIGVWDLHVETKDLRVLGHLKQLLGYNDREVADRLDAWAELIHPDDRDDVMERLAAVLSGAAHTLNVEFRMTHKDGSFRWIASKGAITATTEGKPSRLAGTYADVTERRENAALLGQANDALVRMNRIAAVAEVSASIAHEVNQPLTAIAATAMTGLEWTGSDPASRPLYLLFQDVLEDSRRATHVIERTRGLFANEPGDTADVNLNDVVRHTLEVVRPRARELRVRMLLDLDQRLVVVNGDAVQLQQVVLNLVINALDSMRLAAQEPRKLTIRTRQGKRHVSVSVRDSGGGFGQEVPAHLFERFYTTKSGGTGMGLAIARSIVQTHGGRLWAAVNNDRGATFQFKLPRLDAPSSGMRRLLIVDDDRSMRRSMARLLHSWGYQVAVASGAARAVAVTETFRPDVAILDLAIGDGNGLDLARTMRDTFPDRRMQLYAMTADNDDAVRQACLEVFDAYFVKSGQLTDLERLLRQAT